MAKKRLKKKSLSGPDVVQRARKVSLVVFLVVGVFLVVLNGSGKRRLRRVLVWDFFFNRHLLCR